MTCPGSETWLAFYGGETNEGDTQRLAAHLEECGPCQKEFDQLCSLGAGIRGALAAAPKVSATRPRPRRSRVPASNPSWIPLAAAAAILLAALLLVPNREPR